MAFVQCICLKSVTIVDPHEEPPRRSPAWPLWTGLPRTSSPHAHQPPSGNSQKTAKPASQRFASHALQPMPGRFPHASDPHTGNIPILPQSDHAPAETSGRSTQTYAPDQLTQIPCADEGGMGMASPRDATTTGTLRSSPPEGGLLRAGSADPRGAGAGWIQQKPADVASGQPDPQDE